MTGLSPSELFFLTAQLLGGIGLFIYGMSLMSAELQVTAGNRLRMLIGRLTQQRWAALGVGTLLGFLIHSGPATVMVVSFANAGLIDLVQSVSVVVGANVGTTLSMQIVSLSLDRYSFLVIFAGVVVYLSGRGKKVSHVGLVVVGLGLLFLGMRLMSDAVVPMRSLGYFEKVTRHVNAGTALGMLAGVLLSAVFTGIIQSSGATIGILFALSSAGVFTSIDQVFPLILGAHIGTCVPALIGSVGATISARRAALSHLLFNVIGAGLAMLMFRVYEAVIPAVGGNLVHQIANTHTAVQTFTAAVFAPFASIYAAFVTRLMPSREIEPERSYVDDSVLDRPETAIVAALHELQRMATIARRMFQDTMRGFLDLSPQRFVSVRKREEVLDTIKEALTAYLVSLAGRQLSRRQAMLTQYLLTATADLERIGDHVESMATLTEEKMRDRVWFTDDTVMDLIQLFKKADHILLLTIRSFEPSFYDAPSALAAEILDARNDYVACSQAVRRRQQTKILEKREDAMSAIFFHRYLTSFNKIVKHSKTIALVEKEPWFFVKEHKLDRRSERAGQPGNVKRVAAPYDPKIFDDDGS